MRVLLGIVAACAILASEVMADKSGNATSNCFTRLEKGTLVGDSLTVFTDDGVVIHGNRPILNFASSVLYLTLATDSGPTDHILIPFETINRITYGKLSSARHGLTILGFGIGSAAGIMAGIALVPEPDSFDNLSTIFFAGLFSGVIGMVLGHKIGMNMTSKVTLECR